MPNELYRVIPKTKEHEQVPGTSSNAKDAVIVVNGVPRDGSKSDGLRLKMYSKDITGRPQMLGKRKYPVGESSPPLFIGDLIIRVIYDPLDFEDEPPDDDDGVAASEEERGNDGDADSDEDGGAFEDAMENLTISDQPRLVAATA
ncbi:hypothetical protein V8E52_006725 [Russula decolorans]